MINTVPQHLVVGARTGFLAALSAAPKTDWMRVAEKFSMDAKTQTLVDLGAAPMPTQNVSRPQVQAFIEKTKDVTPVDWDITVGLSHNKLMDDQTGELERKVRSAGDNFNKHINKQVFTVLNAGDSTTYGLCYDGQDFFDSDHADKGAAYSTSQDNEGALTLSLDNFNTTMVAARGTLDDQGEYTDYTYDLIVVPPALEYTAAQIASNAQAYDTANREMNPYAGALQYIVSPYLDSTAWFLIASGHTIKPLILAMREEPNLQASWFDPLAADGGMYYFKFYARYQVHYGDWRLAYMGNS